MLIGMTKIKICGIRDEKILRAAIKAGADFIGLVHYEPSPRHVGLETALALAAHVPDFVETVLLLVDPADPELLAIKEKAHKRLMLQLHGHETPARVAEIKTLTGFPVMKALRVADQKDIELLPDYERVCDWILFDSKPQDASLPGGTGQSFDWRILADVKPKIPWMLSGGLNAENVATALRALKPDSVDVSSGVESARGIKDPAKIKAFIRAVQEQG